MRSGGGHQTDSKPASVLAIGANSIRGRLGHYRTGFRQPSQDRESGLLPCLGETNSTTEAERKPGKAKKSTGPEK
jgi:hypothetical protein